MDSGAIDRLERSLFLLPRSDVRTVHEFLPGIYERTLIIPPWTVLTGAAHKTGYRVRLDAGAIAVTTDEGVRMCSAPDEFDVKAGMRRVGCTFESLVVWTDIYENPDECRDIIELEERLYVVPEFGMLSNRTPEQHLAIVKEQLCLLQ